MGWLHADSDTFCLGLILTDLIFPDRKLGGHIFLLQVTYHVYQLNLVYFAQ